MSAAYRQSSNVTPELLQKDPDNRLLARGPRLRLGPEAIRDQALDLAGLLVDKIGGPAVKPYQPEGLWQELAGGKGYVPDKVFTTVIRGSRGSYAYSGSMGAAEIG